MVDSSHYGANLLQNYSQPGMPLYDVVQGLQQRKTRFDPTMLSKARVEVQRKGAESDRSTYPFQEDFTGYLFGDEKRRVIMFIEGVFHGNTNLSTIIPIDLGHNPHQLFQEPRGNLTIDSIVTFDQTRGYLYSDQFRRMYGEDLAALGVYAFEVEKSRFFYFKQSELGDMFGRSLRKNDTIPLEEMVLLVPSIIPAERVVLTEVEAPSQEVHTPMNVSYRLKQSLKKKLLDRLTDRSYKPGRKVKVRLISDWVAHRPVLPTMDDVNYLEAFLKSNPTIGNSRIEHWYTNDYYMEEPKKGSGRQFKAKNVIVIVTTNGFEPALREIQIVDTQQYHINELRKGAEKHKDYEERKEKKRVRKQRTGDATRRIEDVLGQVFVRENDFISL